MGDKTGIQWTNATWNPVVGCTPVSTGCLNCYAPRQAIRQAEPGQRYHGTVKRTPIGVKWTGLVAEVPQALELPLRWKAPRRVFVNSMSDLFHPGVTDRFVAEVFGVMARARRHTFQILTKRPERMAELVPRLQELLRDVVYVRGKDGEPIYTAWDAVKVTRWPLPNVWLGTSVENQEAANERVPHLAKTTAEVRFLSCEPLLGPVDPSVLTVRPWNKVVDWVIAGGESGPGARPMDLEWARSLRDQCAAAGVAFFMKQLGSVYAFANETRRPDGRADTHAGDITNFPAGLQIREFPRPLLKATGEAP